MLAVAVARRAGESQHDHVGLEAADHPHHVAQDFVVAPFLEGLLRRFGEAEIDGAREELLRAVDAPGGEQLLRAD